MEVSSKHFAFKFEFVYKRTVGCLIIGGEINGEGSTNELKIFLVQKHCRKTLLQCSKSFRFFFKHLCEKVQFLDNFWAKNGNEGVYY